MDSEVYSFVVEWVDRNALNLKKEYKLNYFVKRGRPGEVEMYDCKTRQLFLKRCPYPSLELKELHVGSKVIVFSRQLTVIKYGDEFTSQAFTSSLESSFLFITPSGLNSFHDVLGALFAKDLKIAELRSVALSQSDSMTAFRDEHFSSGLSIAVSVVGNEAVGKIMDISSEFRGQVIPATSQDEANKFAQMFLSKDRMESCQVSTASFSNEAALLIIRPHACREGLTSSILKDIYDAGCSISSAQIFDIDHASSMEFLTIYKGMEGFADMVRELANGQFLALELQVPSSFGEPVTFLRDLAGPLQVDFAKHLRPKSLRAKYGKDKVQNAVHVTDLIEDRIGELEYIFGILNI